MIHNLSVILIYLCAYKAKIIFQSNIFQEEYTTEFRNLTSSIHTSIYARLS